VNEEQISPVPIGEFVRLTARAMNRVSDDSIHALSHSFTGGNDGCDICAAVRARQEAWQRENPPCDCGCDCCGGDE
jgi:hypothetical protein